MSEPASGGRVEQAILDAIPDIILRVRRDGMVVDGRYPAKLEIPLDRAWTGKRLQDLLPEAESAKLLERFARVLETGEIESHTTGWGEGELRRLYEGRIARCSPDELVVLVRDVTEAEATRERLAEAQRLFNRIGQMMPVALYVHDMSTAKNVYITHRLQDLLGYPKDVADEMGDFPLPYLMYPEDVARLPEMLAQVLACKDGEVFGYDVRVRGPKGEERWVRNRSTVFSRNDNGVPVQMLGWVEEVTQQKRLEEELRQSQKMELLGQLAGGIAHDFNNIMTGILCSADFLLRELDAKSPLREEAEQIIESTRKASSLTGRLLSMSRERKLNRAPVDVRAQIASMVPLLNRILGARHPLRFDGTLAGTFIEADPNELEQILINLVVNARDALPDGGPIIVNVAVDGGERAPEVVLSVEDHGVGMTEAVQAEIFRPFFTTKPDGRGTGLGLAYVKRMVETFGGTIAVESAPGKGSRFQLRFPALGEARPSSVAPPPLLEHSGGNVLVLEDDATIRRLVVETLRRDGYTVKAFENGESALALPDDELRSYRVLVSDVVLPGKSGRSTAAALRLRHPGLATVLMSGYYDVDAAVPEIVGEEFLQKPFTPRALADAVARALATAPSAEVAARPMADGSGDAA
jgi:PAS domain S-box-containing protein